MVSEHCDTKSCEHTMPTFQLSFWMTIVLISAVVLMASSAQDDANELIYFEGQLDGKTNKFVHKRDSHCTDCEGVWFIFEENIFSTPNGTHLTIETTRDFTIPEDLFKSIPKLVSLHQSHQNIRLIKSWSFENAKELQFINLSHNAIAEIEENAFKDTSSLKILDLSHNRIAMIPSDIPISVEELYLHNNILTKIALALIPRRIRVLTLNDNDLIELDENGILDDLQYFDISNNARLSDTKFTGFDSKYFGASNISSRTLSISRNADVVKADRNKISSIKFSVDKFGFCNVQELYLAHNSIDYFNMFNLQFPRLKILDLSYNLIKHMSDSSYLFTKMPSLERLNLSYNKLYAFDTSFLSEMINLKVLDISHTKLSSFALKNTSIQVEELFINGNKLEHLEIDIFDKAVNLKKINFHNNKLSRRDVKKFVSLLSRKNITVLEVEMNNQYAIGGHFIVGLTNDSEPMRSIYLKTKLACDNCEPFYEDVWFNVDNPYKNFQVWSLTITESSSPVIQKDLFFAFPNVQNFQMNHQGIEKISEEDFENANHLKKLNLSYNALTELNFNVFRFAEKLNIIDLSYNKISTIENDNENLYLKELFLHGNSLVKFDKAISRNLKVLTLNDNLLRELNWNLFSKTHDPFDRINLSNNPELTSLVAFAYHSTFIDLSNTNVNKLFINDNVEFLKAEYCNISEFEFEVNERYGSRKLKELLLGHNLISSISAFKSYVMYEFTILDLSHNLLEVIDSYATSGLVHLKKINLSHNRLHKIIHGLFSQLPLAFIDLSFNELSDLEISPVALKYLNVEGNRLKELNINNIRSENLKRIGLNGNNWNCQYLSMLIGSLQTVGVALVSNYNVSLLSDTISKYDSNVYGIGCWKTF